MLRKCAKQKDRGGSSDRPDTVEPAADEATGVTERSSRRRFLGGSAKKLAYAAPVVLLFKPRPASASGGSRLTHP